MIKLLRKQNNKKLNKVVIQSKIKRLNEKRNNIIVKINNIKKFLKEQRKQKSITKNRLRFIPELKRLETERVKLTKEILFYKNI